MTRSLDDMPTLGSPPSSPPRQNRKSWARRVERCCMKTFTHFPLLIVYGLTTWAVWVAVGVCFYGAQTSPAVYLKAGLVTLLYGLLNFSYTTAVFTSPGSPLDPRHDAGSAGFVKRKSGGGGSYEGIPAYEQDIDEESAAPHGSMTSVTAKRTGQPRYCKKCHSVKPDRAHHCSSCGRCVLKMDHHCPWLATCVGLQNYKAFILFLIYTSLFCWICFAISAGWVWAEIVDDTQMQEGMRVVNTILLAILGGIIGLVLSGFTGWHLYLCITGQTTIESLEKTRYLSPLRKTLAPQPHRSYVGSKANDESRLLDEDQTFTEQLKEIHANALPGVLRPEEGDEALDPTHSPPPSDSPAKSSLQRSYADLEAQREHDRYAAYLDEQDSETLPNAFNVGWKRNLAHVFGASPFLWALPVCNSSGNGWQWDVSPAWVEARDRLASQRAARVHGSLNSSFEPPTRTEFIRWTPGIGFADEARTPPLPPPPRAVGVQMQPLDRRKAQASDSTDSYETSSSSDEDAQRMYRNSDIQGVGGTGIANWNDVPDEYLTSRTTNKARRSRSRGRRKGD